MFSLMLESRERRESADYENRARAAADRLMATVAQDGELLKNAPWIGEMIFDTIPAEGVGVCLDGTISLSGLAPDQAQFGEIVKALNRVSAGQVFATDSIQTLVPEAAGYADRAAGLIAIPLSRSPRDYVVLFRSEQLRSVRWAGNPEKPVELGPHGDRLTPRKSFELWSELVKGRSLPFTPSEHRVAESIRSGMLEVLVRLSEAAGEERARAHERQELLIAELNHRVRNILALIRGLVSQSRSGNTQSVGDFTATLDDRIRALARAHDQITADRWGPARLRDLIEIEAGAYLGDRRDRVMLEGPNLLIQPAAFTTVALVFHELMTMPRKRPPPEPFSGRPGVAHQGRSVTAILFGLFLAVAGLLFTLANFVELPFSPTLLDLMPILFAIVAADRLIAGRPGAALGLAGGWAAFWPTRCSPRASTSATSASCGRWGWCWAASAWCCARWASPAAATTPAARASWLSSARCATWWPTPPMPAAPRSRCSAASGSTCAAPSSTKAAPCCRSS